MKREDLANKILTDDKVLARALIVLNERQTFDEKVAQDSLYQNNSGVRKSHAKKLTGMVNFFNKTGFLTEKQKNWWRTAATENSPPRILIYLGQLYSIHLQKIGG